MKQRYRKSDRLTTRGDFNRCYRQGRRLQTAFFTVHAYRSHGGRVRLGLAVGRRIGAAVVRNRVKRRLREIFRLHKTSLPAGYDLFIRASPTSAQARYQELDTAFCDAIAGLRAEGSGGPPSHVLDC